MENKEEKNKQSNVYAREWQRNNRDKVNASFRKWRKKRAEWFCELKSGLKCHLCRENNPACLDFHHKNPELKEFVISEVKLWRSKQALMAEIEKCVVLCANCHRKIHDLVGHNLLLLG